MGAKRDLDKCLSGTEYLVLWPGEKGQDNMCIFQGNFWEETRIKDFLKNP